MENASRAMIIAGGILIGMLIIGALAYMFTELGNYQSDQVDKLEVEQLAEFNEQFLTYDRDNVTIMELKSLYNKIESSNEQYNDKNFNVTLTIKDTQPPMNSLIDSKEVEKLAVDLIKLSSSSIPTAAKENAKFESVEIKFRDNGTIQEMIFEDQTKTLPNADADY